MKVKTSYVPAECEYLTVGKEYEVFNVEGNIFGNGGNITADDGDDIWIHIPNSSHIGNRTWEVIPDAE